MNRHRASAHTILLAALLLVDGAGCAMFPFPSKEPAVKFAGDSGQPTRQSASPPANSQARRPGHSSSQEKYGVRLTGYQASIQDDEPAKLPKPRTDEAAAEPVQGVTSGIGIEFGTALAMAAGQNPRVGLAQARIDEAYANLAASRAMWLPSIRAGGNYHKHEGRIQDVAGNIIETSRGSVYGGLGAFAVGAGSPAVPGVYANFRVSDAVFQPRIARAAASAREFAADATTHEVMLAAALAYVDLLDASQSRAIAEETLRNAQALADLTARFAKEGQGTGADSDRARSELAVRQNNVARADEAMQVASARLAELLSQDPTILLVPREPAIAPIDMQPRDMPAQDFVALGLTNRPELAECRHLVAEAVERLHRERLAPLLPSVLLGASYGTTGGGLGSRLDRFGDRADFDAVAYWELRNLGLGERAARRGAHSRIDQAQFEQVRVMDRVAREIVEAHAQSVQRYRQISTAQQGIAAARDSFRKNFERIREGQGLPLEALQSIQALDQAQREYLRAVTSYNQAQFSLTRALGWPN